MSDEIELRIAWAAVAGRAPVASRRAESVLDDLLSRHRQPHRHYHGVRHVVWVIRHVHELAEPAGPIDVPIAIAASFFHDAIYDPTAADNEERSAQLAARQLTAIGWAVADTDVVADCVRATAGHFDQPADPVAPDALTRGRAVLLDADLAVLGADPAGYQAYVNGVRSEYDHLDPDAWRAGRAAVLARLLARPALYLTATGRERWEARARANLAAELASLA